MLALRFAGLLATAVWFGGLLTLGTVVAPALFEAFAGQAEGRLLAGAGFGAILRRFHFVAYACTAVILGTLVARAVLGPRPRRFALRVALTAVLLAASLYSGVIVSGAIERLQQEIGSAPSSLRADDPRRAAFARLHTQSTMLQLIPFIGTLVLLAFELKD